MLGTNHRSTTALVAAVNHWFGRAEARAGAGAFLFRDAAGQDDPLPFVPVQARGRAEQFQTATGPVPALAIHHDLELHSAGTHRQRFAARCAAQIVDWLNDAQAGFAQPEKPLQRLRPADIAVLVRTGQEAEAIRRELHRRGVASVYLSDKDSVFASDERATGCTGCRPWPSRSMRARCAPAWPRAPWGCRSMSSPGWPPAMRPSMRAACSCASSTASGRPRAC